MLSFIYPDKCSYLERLTLLVLVPDSSYDAFTRTSCGAILFGIVSAMTFPVTFLIQYT